jgi:hypothetical protein
MFDNLDYPKSLDEELFDTWLEKGRESKIGYTLLIVAWDDFESDFVPIYAETRDKIKELQRPGCREHIIAVYDLYSESRIM